MRTVEPSVEDGGYRSDPDMQVVDVELSFPTKRHLTRSLYPPTSLYYSSMRNSLNSDLTSTRRTSQRKRARDAHSVIDATIEKIFADELLINQSKITAIVKKLPHIGTIPRTSDLLEKYKEIVSSVGMKVREYDHAAGDVVSSITIFFKNSYGIVSGLESPIVNYSFLATSMLDLARGAPPNKSLMCKSMMSREYLRYLIIRSYESRRTESDWRAEIQGYAANLLSDAHHRSRPEYLPGVIRKIRAYLYEKHSMWHHPNVEDGHKDFLSEELASVELLREFDSLFSQSIMTDVLFEKALHKIVYTHTNGVPSPCTACEPVIDFLPILLTGKPGETYSEVGVVDTAEQMMLDEISSILELPSEAWLSMPSENSDRSIYMSNYIGGVLSGEADDDEVKYNEYSEAGIKFIRSITTTDSRYEEVRAQADRIRIRHQEKQGAMPDLVN